MLSLQQEPCNRRLSCGKPEYCFLMFCQKKKKKKGKRKMQLYLANSNKVSGYTPLKSGGLSLQEQITHKIKYYVVGVFRNRSRPRTPQIRMMMMNYFCGMVGRRNAVSLISSWDHCQRSSPSRISDTPRAGSESAQNLSSGFVECS